MSDTVQISPINTETIHVPIVGLSPLIVHKFSEKAKRQMLDNMQGRKTPKQAKDPQAEYEASLYRLKDGDRLGFPAVAFKKATIGGARFYGKDVTMTSLRQFLWFSGEASQDGQMLVPIVGEPEMREDVVTVGRGSDLRYRGMFRNWEAVLEIRYAKSSIDRNSVVSLIDAGGMGVGVGEWRPEKGGDFGQYTVHPDRDVQVLA